MQRPTIDPARLAAHAERQRLVMRGVISPTPTKRRPEIDARRLAKHKRRQWLKRHGIEPRGIIDEDSLYQDWLVGNPGQLALSNTDHPTRKIRYRRTEDLVEATRRLSAKLPPRISGVAGIPRSGMFPAGLVAMWHHVPLFELSPQAGLRPLGHGGRGYSIHIDADAPLVVIDDSVYGGASMTRARKAMGNRNCVYAATFVRPECADLVDTWGELTGSPHIFEWNLFCNWVLGGGASDPILRGGFATDFDGVLCFDPPVPDSDHPDGEARYREWIINAKPRVFTRVTPIPLIVTYRLERYRQETEDWLRRYGMLWRQLVMHPAKTFAERNATFDPGAHKGLTYRHSPTTIFLESDERQCEPIFHVAGKPVICTTTGKVWQ